MSLWSGDANGKFQRAIEYCLNVSAMLESCLRRDQGKKGLLASRRFVCRTNVIVTVALRRSQHIDESKMPTVSTSNETEIPYLRFIPFNLLGVSSDVPTGVCISNGQGDDSEINGFKWLSHS
jgi:hypothetical protein